MNKIYKYLNNLKSEIENSEKMMEKYRENAKEFEYLCNAIEIELHKKREAIKIILRNYIQEKDPASFNKSIITIDDIPIEDKLNVRCKGIKIETLKYDSNNLYEDIKSLNEDSPIFKSLHKVVIEVQKIIEGEKNE